MSEQADRDELAEALADDALIEAVGAAIWQANNELTKPEYRHMPDAEARTYFARAVVDAILASDWPAQRDRRVAAGVLREAAEEAHREARYIAERTMRGQRPDPLERVTLLESVLRERADRIEAGDV